MNKCGRVGCLRFATSRNIKVKVRDEDYLIYLCAPCYRTRRQYFIKKSINELLELVSESNA